MVAIVQVEGGTANVSFLMANFPTEDSPPGPTTMAPGPHNLLTAQLGPKVDIRRLWRFERRLSGPPRA